MHSILGLEHEHTLFDIMGPLGGAEILILLVIGAVLAATVVAVVLGGALLFAQTEGFLSGANAIICGEDSGA